MDETPEELEQIRREAAVIDPYKYRRRRRAMIAVAIGALGATVVGLGLEGFDRARNPCDRLRDHFCAKDAKSLDCLGAESVAEESVKDPSKHARGLLRGQCEGRIERLKADDGIAVP